MPLSSFAGRPEISYESRMVLRRIVIHPIKSLDGVERPSARITPAGSLEHDRAWAIFDAAGDFVNGKRTARVHEIRSAFSEDLREVRLWTAAGENAADFVLAERGPIDAWLSEFFGFRVELRSDLASGFPDDMVAPGPTIASEQSLAEVADWFSGLSIENLRRRFRTNLEFDAAEAFAEDRLFGAEGEPRSFRVGEVAFLGLNPCQRCVVPTRDPDSGEQTARFARRFAEFRRESLPDGACRERFDHFYRFAVNTSVPATEAGRTLRVGDLLDPSPWR
jgi:uncharacterized protein YcbX